MPSGLNWKLERARNLVRLLERLSADSIWARRSSGVRGALLKYLDEMGEGQLPTPEDLARLDNLIAWGERMLQRGAAEIPDIEQY
jgi:hypothetical protein